MLALYCYSLELYVGEDKTRFLLKKYRTSIYE